MKEVNNIPVGLDEGGLLCFYCPDCPDDKVMGVLQVKTKMEVVDQGGLAGATTITLRCRECSATGERMIYWDGYNDPIIDHRFPLRNYCPGSE